MLNIESYKLQSKSMFVDKTDEEITKEISNVQEEIKKIKDYVKEEITKQLPAYLKDNGWACRRVDDDFIGLAKQYEDDDIEIIKFWIADFNDNFKFTLGSISSRGDVELKDFSNILEQKKYDYYIAIANILTDNIFLEYLEGMLKMYHTLHRVIRSNKRELESILHERVSNKVFEDTKTWFYDKWIPTLKDAAPTDYVRVNKSVIDFPFLLTWKGKNVAPYEYLNGCTVYTEQEKTNYINSISRRCRDNVAKQFVQISTLKVNGEWINH